MQRSSLHQAYPFKATREYGLARLNAFLPHAGASYAKERNFDRGSVEENAVSALSPFLCRRMLTEQEVVDRVLQQHSFSDAEKYLQEICWRTYWKGWLEMRPQVWTSYLKNAGLAKKEVDADRGLLEKYRQAVQGKTSLTAFNYWVKELITAGYLHNHARMWFAGIWIFDFGLPWELGADFFARHLLDGDAASNTLSWRWVAGLQTRGKRYVPSAGNIQKFTGGRFDSGDEISPTESGPDPESREELDPKPLHFDPRPSKADTLLLCKEDFALDLPEPWRKDVKKVILWSAYENDGPIGWRPSARINAYDAMAVQDAAVRWAEVTEVECLAGSDLESWWNRMSPERVAMPRAPVGFISDQLEALWMKSEKKPQIWVRNWDRRLWPHAQAGFFKYWKKVNRFLTGDRVDIAD